jgi:hypothetical protein
LIDQTLLDSITNRYPWATEEQAARLAELSRSHNIKSTALAAAIAQVTNSSDVETIEKMVDDAMHDAERAEDTIKNYSNKVKSELKDAKSALSSASGIEGIADLTHAGTKALHAVTKSASDMVAGGNTVVAGVSNVATFATGTAVATAGMGTIFASLITEQEKTVKAMMDFGLVVGDDALYTNLRSRVANFAMGVADYTSVLESTKQMMTNVSGDVYSGQIDLINFLDGAIDSETVSRFGYSPQEFALQLGQEAATLFKLNQINSLNAIDQKRVIDSFETVNKLSLFMADNIGIQRSTALALRQESRENLDMQLVMFQQADYIQEELGEQARVNIQEANDFLYILMSETIGNEMARETQQVFTHFVRDMQFDTSAVNNIPQDLMETLQRISPDTAREYISLIEDAGTGKISADDMILRYQKFAKTVKEATAIRAQVATIPESFFDITADELKTSLEQTQDVADIAGLSVDQVGNIAIGFKKAQSAITPGYETMGNLFKLITGSAQKFGEVWSDVFGLDDFATVEERSKVYSERERLDALAHQYGTYQHGYSESTKRGFGRSSAEQRSNLIAELQGRTEELQTEYQEQLASGNDTQAEQTYTELAADMEELVRLQNGGAILPRDSRVSSPDIINGGLLDFIGRGEGSYTASNRGTIKGIGIVGSNMDTMRRGKSLTDMTFAEIFELQSIISPRDKDRLFAVGKYQIIPSTMQEIFPHSGLKLTDKFTPENQDILGSLLVVGNEETGYAKRAKLAAYIRGESDNLHDAMLDFAREWASAPDPRTGMSYYGSGNRASHSRDEVAAALIASREQYAINQSLNNDTSSAVTQLETRQTQLQDQIKELNSKTSSSVSASELSEMREEITKLEQELFAVTEQLNSELASQNATEAHN